MAHEVERVKKKRNPLIDKICLDICDGDNGRCRRYPIIYESCEDFVKLKKAYEIGLKNGKEKQSK